MTTILIHFVDFDRLISQFCRHPVLQPLFLDPMPPGQQGAIVSPQFLGQLGCGLTLHDPPQQQHNFRTTIPDPTQHGAREDIEHPSTLPTPVFHDWSSGTVVRSLFRRQRMSMGTTQSSWMQDLRQKIVTLFFIHQVINGKWEHILNSIKK